MTLTIDQPRAAAAFHHEALFYAGLDEFVTGVAPFVRAAVDADEPVLVAVSGAKATLLQRELGARASGVDFADMPVIGRNPARIIPVWREFVAAHDGRSVRGVGEPIWPDRTPDELTECQHHESLLNLAFADAPAWSLLCPYDTGALAPDVVATARCTHPQVRCQGVSRASDRYVDPVAGGAPFHGPLAPAAPDAVELAFRGETLGDVRGFARAWGRTGRLAAERTSDFVLAVSELAANSVRHGGGAGTIRIWQDGTELVCEVSDGGAIAGQPLVGRARPGVRETGGRGLWMVNQLCDLVQIRAVPGGTVVRVRVDLG